MADNRRAEKQSQRERFEEAACELGVELDEQKLKETLRKIAPSDGKVKPKLKDD